MYLVGFTVCVYVLASLATHKPLRTSTVKINSIAVPTVRMYTWMGMYIQYETNIKCLNITCTLAEFMPLAIRIYQGGPALKLQELVSVNPINN